MLTLGESTFNIIAPVLPMLAVCISISVNVIVLITKTLWKLLSKESTPVACLMELEVALMSMLGYTMKATTVS